MQVKDKQRMFLSHSSFLFEFHNFAIEENYNQMNVNSRSGQRLMNLDNPNEDEVKKMAGEPAQSGSALDKRPRDESPVVFLDLD